MVEHVLAQVLTSVGFSQEMQNSPVAALSGGWKMKLALGELPRPVTTSRRKSPAHCTSVILFCTCCVPRCVSSPVFAAECVRGSVLP